MTTRVEAAQAYASLGVPHDASWAQVRHAYRARLRAAHPDTGAGDPVALAAARSAYRQLESQFRNAPPDPTPPRRIDIYA